MEAEMKDLASEAIDIYPGYNRRTRTREVLNNNKFK